MWDDTLQNVADGYASTCNYAHNPDRTSSQSVFFYVGENLAISSSSTLGVDDAMMLAVDLWVTEVQDYTYSTNTCALNKVCGHYTQVKVSFLKHYFPFSMVVYNENKCKTS